MFFPCHKSVVAHHDEEPKCELYHYGHGRENIGESVEIHSPETTFSYTMSFWIVGCGLNKKQSSE